MTACVVANFFDSFPANLYFWMLLGVAACLAAERRSQTPELTEAIDTT